MKIINPVLMNEYSQDKYIINNNDFNRFVKGCIDDLKENGITFCYYKDQIEELKKVIDINYYEEDGYFVVTLCE